MGKGRPGTDAQRDHNAAQQDQDQNGEGSRRAAEQHVEHALAVELRGNRGDRHKAGVPSLTPRTSCNNAVLQLYDSPAAGLCVSPEKLHRPLAILPVMSVPMLLLGPALETPV